MSATVSSDRPLRIARLLGLIRRETGRGFDKAVVLQTAGALSEAMSVALLVPMLHLMSSNGNAVTIAVGSRAAVVTLPLLLAGFVLLIALRAVALQRKEALSARVTFGFVETMSCRLFEALAHTRWAVVSRWRTADMSHVLVGNGDRLLHAVNLLMLLVQSAAVAAVFTALSFLLSWRMTLVAVAVGAMLLLVTYPMRTRSLRNGREITQARLEQHRITDEFLNGLRTSKAFGIEAQHVTTMKGVLARIRGGHVRFMTSRARTATVHQVATALALAAFIYFALSVAEIALPRTVALLFLYMRLVPRIVMLHTTMQELLAQIGAVEAVLAVLDAAEANAEARPPLSSEPRPLLRSVEIRGVSFAYPESEATALSRISVTIPAGKITGLMGPTGSGKSTLVDLLLGLVRPAEGAILIDDAELADDHLRAWQASIGYVPQETFLFNGSIAGNLRMVAPHATDGELWMALEAADAADLVRGLADGLDHAIGDRGRSLSGGERQRLAIARALVRKPSLLILDEATSALDALSQRRVGESLRRLCRDGMTVVMVAHRASMIAFADFVIALENGQLADTGTFSRILSAPEGVIREMIDADGSRDYMTR